LKSYVLDASVAFAWYLPELFSAAARGYRDRVAAGKIRCLVPDLHYLEMANALRTRVRLKQIPEELAREILDTHLDADLEIADIAPSRALDVALEYESTVYDATYIALALDHDLQLLTAERTTTPWVVRLGERVVSLHLGLVTE
jgi:predicted nucleic acid-binding protein